MSDWLSTIGAVALALADEWHQTGPDQSMLEAVTGPPSALLRQQLLRLHAQEPGADDVVEPLIYQNEIPPYLLSLRLVEIAGAASAGVTADKFAKLSPPDRSRHQVTGLVAVAALSSLGLEPPRGPDQHAAAVRRRLREFGTVGWTAALDQLASRTAELRDLLTSDHGRRQSWRHVSVDDRVLAEALAAAVVGGAGDECGVPPERWLFPFHLFCKLALSAAEDALATIESWLGIEFAPRPRTLDRAASLAVLVAGEASSLHRGCACKAAGGSPTVAFERRGPCRQADHQLGSWLPGEPKPGGSGGLYAATLWGWLRRWLGGTDAGRAAGEGRSDGRPRLRPHDVAGSVLARRWLHVDHGDGGPVLLYDRILPEFCENCGRKAEITTITPTTGPARVERRDCCERPRRVYRSEFSERAGKRIIKPKLGLIVASLEGSAGYRSTEPAGELWLCTASGRYFLSPGRCPDCGPVTEVGRHDAVHHGWVLLPLADAWADLRHPAGQPSHAPHHAESELLDRAALASLEQVFRAMYPQERAWVFTSPADVWKAAREWTDDEMDEFRALAGQPGLELLLLCKLAAEAALPEGTGGAGT